MPKWGLALGAGGFHGIAHLGVIRVLQEEGLLPDFLAGTSAGAIALGLYASGIPLNDAAATIASLATPQNLDFVGGLRSMVPGYILTRSGVIQGDLIESILDRMTGGRSLAEIQPVVAIEAVDIVSGELVVMTNYKGHISSDPLPHTAYLKDVRLSQAVRASISIPGLFSPKEMQGRYLVDGGVRDMVPTRILRSLGAQVVVAVDLGSAVGHPQQVKNFPEILMRALALLEREAMRDRLVASANVIIAPPLPSLPSLDKEKFQQHIDIGAEATRAKLPEIRRYLGVPPR